MNSLAGLWEFLGPDVAFLGGPHSPMLSWLGSCGIVLFFLWQVLKIAKETAVVRRAFDRVRPMLDKLAEERAKFNHLFSFHSRSVVPGKSGRTAQAQTRIDCDDLEMLDAGIQQEPMIYGPWGQYRRTLILEQTPWFMEPRVFSTRPAAEVLTQEALILHRVNLRFYQQFPSLVTGIGLLLTFLALFIALGKLHADGSEIIGIQGLINGLSGKFLTSIVALIVANVFTLIEKALVSKLLKAHYMFLNRIDQLFPRKTIEQMLEHLTSIQSPSLKHPRTSDGERREYDGGRSHGPVADPAAHLTAAIQSLTGWQQDEGFRFQHVMTEFSRAIREELHDPIRKLTGAIEDLSRRQQNTHHHSIPRDMPREDRPLLWNTSAFPRKTLDRNVFERLGAWSRRSWQSKERRTG